MTDMLPITKEGLIMLREIEAEGSAWVDDLTAYQNPIAGGQVLRHLKEVGYVEIVTLADLNASVSPGDELDGDGEAYAKAELTDVGRALLKAQK